MATLYLHIGMPKTGTTAIQRFCEENAAALAARGYCYPMLPYKYRDVPLRRNAHFLVAPDQRKDGGFARRREERAWHGRVARLARRFRKYPNVVLSDESLWNRTAFGCRGLWKNLKREADALGFDVRIIVYLRRQDQFFTSLWAQAVKCADAVIRGMCWEDALSRSDEWIEMDYARHLEEIAAQFGRECVAVRVYDRERFVGGNIVPDFLDALGLRAEPDFAMPSNYVNPSLGGNALEIKRIINNLPNLKRKQLLQARRVAEACYAIERKQQKYSMFTDAELAAFLQRYEESNRRVARDFLGEETGALFAAPGPQPPKWTPDNPHMLESFERFLRLAMTSRGDTRRAWLLRFARRNLRRARRALKRG